jgi:serine/threonine-protein kinase RsbT
MSPAETRLNEILTKHLSPIVVKGILRKAKERIGVIELNEATLPTAIKALHTSLKIFLTDVPRAELLRQLDNLSGMASAATQKIPIRRESDILFARGEAATIAQQMNANRFAVQRVVTAISELARNIVNYTPGGNIELIPDPPSKMKAIAIDEGSGIQNLDEIMSGNYRSSSGMGMGLRGVRSLSSAFMVETSSKGTRIEIEVSW